MSWISMFLVSPPVVRLIPIQLFAENWRLYFFLLVVCFYEVVIKFREDTELTSKVVFDTGIDITQT